MNAIAPSLDYGSVCSGIEAVTVAWKPLGLTAAWYSEIAPFPSAVLAHRYPRTPNLGDMSLIAERVLSGDVCAPGVLVGGTPCQSFSIAGMRQGLADARGTLTLKYAELANAIDKVRTEERKPSTILVWENVPGVLSDRGNAFGCFLGAIAGEDHELHPPGHAWTHAGCVYGPQRSVAWRVLDAQYFGLAQRRQRVFVVASSRTDIDPAAILFEHGGLRRDSSPREEARQDTSTASPHCAAGESRAEESPSHRPRDELPIACFGGGNTAGPITRAACLMARGHKCDFEIETFAVQGFTGAVSHALNTANRGKGSSEDGSGRGVPIVGITRNLSASQCGFEASSGEVSHPLTCAHSVTGDNHGRGVPIISVSYELNGLPSPIDGSAAAAAFAQNSRGEVRWEGGDGRRIGALSAGGGIPGQGVPTVALADASWSDDSTSLEAHFECRPTHASDTANSEWWQQWHVRRLMPLECERLQGFPDNYTLVPYRGAPAADGPRYASIGNSMAVPCVAWIGRRLMNAVARTRRN